MAQKLAHLLIVIDIMMETVEVYAQPLLQNRHDHDAP